MSFLFKENRRLYRELSEKTGFHKDIMEKVHRLIAILEYINSNAFLQERLVLKGGTALNLTLFNLPRLSLASSKNKVKEFLSNSLVLTPKHKEYLEQFAAGRFKPELLFSGKTLDNIKYHPMAIWKTMDR